MFGIVIFYPAGQPIRNRSGAEKCRMHGVPCFAAFHLPRVCSIPLGWSGHRERNPKNKTICLWQMVLFLVRAWGLEPQRRKAREPKSRMSANFIMPA